jgi:hypothetical protein
MTFSHHNIGKFNRTSPNGKTNNQIDHILIDMRRNSSVLDVQSFMGSDFDTEHYLVVTKFRERLAVSKHAMHRFYMERISRN